MKLGNIFQVRVALQVKVVQFKIDNQPGIQRHKNDQGQQPAKGVSFVEINKDPK
jgi:hypothetical protein